MGVSIRPGGRLDGCARHRDGAPAWLAANEIEVDVSADGRDSAVP